MRSLRNFLYLIVGLLLGCLSVFAFAADTNDAGVPGNQNYPVKWTLSENGGYTSAGSFESQQSACLYNPALGLNGTIKSWDSGQGANAICLSSAGGSTWLYSVCKTHSHKRWPGYPGNATGSATHCVEPNACPQGSTLANGKCTCNAGLVFFGGKCQAPKCNSVTDGPEMMFDIGTSPTNSPDPIRCLGGCVASFSGRSPVATSVVNGVRRYYAKGQYTTLGNGSSDICTAGPSNPDAGQGASSQTPPDSCPAGHGMIKIDGKVNCVNTSTGASTAEPPQTDNKTTTRNQVTNPDNSTTVTTTTKNNITGGTTTVTETYPPGVAPGSGQPSGSSTVSTGGGAGGIGSGTGSGNGDGDKDACEDDPQRVGCKHLDEILGDPVDGPDISNGTETLTFTPVAGFGSGSYSCPSNPSMNVSILGKSITVFDYAPVCQFASGVRPVVLAFAALAAALIGLGVGRRD